MLVFHSELIDHVDQDSLLAPDYVDLFVNSLLFADDCNFEFVALLNFSICQRPVFLLKLQVHLLPFSELLPIFLQLSFH